MICYKDMTFCTYGVICKNPCGRVLTDKIKQDAEKSGLPITVFADFPDCFVPWFAPNMTNTGDK